jgi:hypothetical protein
MEAYLEAFGLNFGCFDFAVSQSGETAFLECNPNGQWLWVEELAGLPIGAAIAELLVDACTSDGEHLGNPELLTPQV